MNGKWFSTNHSINGKKNSACNCQMFEVWLILKPYDVMLLQQFDITHGKKSVFLFETLGEIRWAGKAGIESNL